MKVKIAMWVFTILWMLLIFILSSQTGKRSTQASQGIAEYIAEIIYDQPTQQQIDQVHIFIRKLAHIGLFFISGVLTYSAFANTFTIKKRKYLSIIGPILIISGYGFLDEWRKQFIDGRHFHTDEAVLNIISGICGICVTFFICFLIKKQIQADRE